jgi:hypothetical protein
MWNKLQPLSGKCIRIVPGTRQQCHSHFLRQSSVIHLRVPLAVLAVLTTTMLGLSHLKDNTEAFWLNVYRLAEPYKILVRTVEFLVVSILWNKVTYNLNMFDKMGIRSPKKEKSVGEFKYLERRQKVKQVLGRTNRLFSFNTTRTTWKTTCRIVGGFLCGPPPRAGQPVLSKRRPPFPST